MSARRIDKALGLGVLVLAVLLALAPLFLASPPESVRGSASSSAEKGRLALFLLAQELGFAPEAWKEPPGRLPRGGHLLWLAGAPKSWTARQLKTAAPLGAEKSDSVPELPEPAQPDEPRAEPEPGEPAPPPPEPSSDPDKIAAEEESPTPEEPARDTTPAALGLQVLSNYRGFVDEGGTLVMRFDARARSFLCDGLGLEVVRDLELDKDAPAGPRRLHTESGEELDVEWPKASVFRELPPNGSVRALWTAARSSGEREEVLAVVAPIGSGRLVLLCDDRFVDNANLRQKDHALLAVRLAEHLPSGGRLLFDEFALGLWQPKTAGGLATSPRLFLITAHLMLLLCLFVWTKVWVSTFPRDPPELARLSPLSRARARAALCQRAGRYDLLAGMLKRGSLRRWRALARLRPSPAQSSATEPVEAEMARIALNLGLAPDSERGRELTRPRSVRNAADLEALARDLDRAAQAIETEERRSTRRAG